MTISVHSNHSLLCKCWLIFFYLLYSFPVFAQFYDCSTGLLQSPTAEMQESGTFMITNNFLNEKTLPQGNEWWGYNTFSYGINITFFSRVEIGYVCVLYRGQDNGFWPKSTWGHYTNQDRHFLVRVQVVKEGDFGLSWMPSIVIGASDPYTLGIVSPEKIASRPGNGFFNRNYICASKHFTTKIGTIGLHIGYQYNERTDLHYNAPCGGISWNPIWFENCWVNPKFILEYDSRSPNIGLIADIWNSRFQAMFELQNFQWISFGLRYKICLKGAE